MPAGAEHRMPTQHHPADTATAHVDGSATGAADAHVTAAEQFQRRWSINDDEDSDDADDGVWRVVDGKVEGVRVLWEVFPLPEQPDRSPTLAHRGEALQVPPVSARVHAGE